ncbi:hypothetical protein V1L54_06290 [Streptomyces sp. TRM 70361]|uniref:PH-like domain-containing protein n=1 Tax=Streptomyces sp. TRM 70361 TaxID=3116553 RepID=UPI002E7BB1DB|nr:hypothetical protein [Streptomyces sp. TRM 70361]MEE1939027.1 hypothetical protein [Streptomyces sp. TRM 70361]
MNPSQAALAARYTAAPESQQVTDLASRIAWVVGLALVVALLYWLMREGWKWRAVLQSDLPELPQAPAGRGEPRLVMTGRYHGSTTAGQWLDRIVAHGLGTRSRAELTLTEQGVDVVRPGAASFFIPAGRLRGARLDKGIAGKVLTEDGLLVITWEHGGRLLDSGFRSDRSAEHTAWRDALRAMSAPEPAGTADDPHGTTDAAATTHHGAAPSRGTAPGNPEKGAR